MTTQQEILTGLMLGDGCLRIQERCINASLQMTRALYDNEYNIYLKNKFYDVCTDKSLFSSSCFDERTNKIYYSSNLRTRVSKLFTETHKRWYIDNKKTIPKDLELTALAIAIWFADDGCISVYKEGHKKSGVYGKIYPHLYTISFATHGFSLPEVNFLNAKMNERYGFYLHRINSGNNQYTLHCFTAEQSKTILRDIDPVFPFGMERKSNIWRAKEAELYIDYVRPQCVYCSNIGTVKQGKYANGDTVWVCKQCKKQFRASDFVETIQLENPIYLAQKTP